MARAKNVELTQEQSDKLLEWKSKKDQLDILDTEEFALRQWIVKNLGFDPDKLEGSQTLSIGSGWKISADKVQNYTVSNDNGQAMIMLNMIGSATGLDRADIAQSLVKWKPELSVSSYRDFLPLVDKLPGLKEAMSAAITIKAGAPQLKLIPPKEEDKKESNES